MNSALLEILNYNAQTQHRDLNEFDFTSYSIESLYGLLYRNIEMMFILTELCCDRLTNDLTKESFGEKWDATVRDNQFQAWFDNPNLFNREFSLTEVQHIIEKFEIFMNVDHQDVLTEDHAAKRLHFVNLFLRNFIMHVRLLNSLGGELPSLEETKNFTFFKTFNACFVLE